MKIKTHLFLWGEYKKGIAYVDGNTLIEFLEKDVDPDHIITEGFVNSHTHIGDSFVKDVPRMGIMELVGPGGFKQRMLENADKKLIIKSMAESVRIMEREYVRSFFDFRESGIYGLKLIKSIKFRNVRPVILTRPISGIYDQNEVDFLLENSDGIGLSSISDYDYDFISKVARRTKEKGKIFSIHVSERVREDIDNVISLKPDFIIHMHKATEEDLKKVADEKIKVVLTPRSSMFFGTIVDFQRFKRNGIEIALGTDNAMISVPSIRMEMSFSYYLSLDPIEILKAFTISMDKFIDKPKKVILFKAKPAEIVKNPFLPYVKVLNITDEFLKS